MAWFASRAGAFGLCVGCLLNWWPAKSAAWLEERMQDYRDHIDDRLVAQLQRDGLEARRSRIVQPRPGDRRPGMKLTHYQLSRSIDRRCPKVKVEMKCTM